MILLAYRTRNEFKLIILCYVCAATKPIWSWWCRLIKLVNYNIYENAWLLCAFSTLCLDFLWPSPCLYLVLLLMNSDMKVVNIAILNHTWLLLSDNFALIGQSKTSDVTTKLKTDNSCKMFQWNTSRWYE